MEVISEKAKDDIQDQIIYRGEGNSSIVIALKDRAKVIRLLKKDGKIMKSSLDHHVTQHPMSNIRFIHLIMRPLTDHFLSGSTELVHLKSDFVSIISKRVEAERPLHRLDKILHLDDQYALVMDDLCTLSSALTQSIQPEYDLCGPTISIEIKPKQGFLPIHRHAMKSTTNDPSTDNQLKSSCLYGSTQFLKLARGRIKETSSYCPINLFSGCPIKMHSALEGLLKNPQNNFRIFKNLVLAYDEGNRSKLSNVFQDFFQSMSETSSNIDHERRLIDLLIRCLLSESPTKTNIDRKSDMVTNNGLEDENICSDNLSNGRSCTRHKLVSTCRRCDSYPSSKKSKTGISSGFKNHELPSSCVLASVLRAQQLDTIGAYEARQMLDWLLENCSDSMDVLEELSKPQMPRGFGSPCRLQFETREQYYFRKVWEFLVSLTAKDCSIIITVRRISPGRHDELLRRQRNLKEHILVDNKTGTYFLFNVGIADLDQKMPLKIYRICDNLNQTTQQISMRDDATRKKDAPINAYLHEGRKYMIS